GADARDERRRARTEIVLRAARGALREVRRALPRARSLAALWRRTERELDRLLPTYLLAQDDVVLVQETILRARARLGLPIGAPPALEAGRELAAALARGDAKALRARFGHRGGVELDVASAPLAETLPPSSAPRSSGRAPRAKRAPAEHPAIERLLRHGRAAAKRADRLRDAVTLAIRTARAIALRAGRGEDVFFLRRDELLRALEGERVSAPLAA